MELKVRNAGIDYWEVIKNGFFYGNLLLHQSEDLLKCAALHAGINQAMPEKKTLQVLE